MPGYCFSKFDVVSGIIWPVISGLDTTATVTVPELLALPLPLLLVPPLEQAASASNAATPATAPNARSLNRNELMNEPPHGESGGGGNASPSCLPHLCVCSYELDALI